MPYYDHNKDYPFAAFITNLGKYNEGELVGEWVKFPTTAEELKEVFKRIGIGQKDDFGQPYEEWFITDYDCYVDGLYSKLHPLCGRQRNRTQPLTLPGGGFKKDDLALMSPQKLFLISGRLIAVIDRFELAVGADVLHLQGQFVDFRPSIPEVCFEADNGGRRRLAPIQQFLIAADTMLRQKVGGIRNAFQIFDGRPAAIARALLCLDVVLDINEQADFSVLLFRLVGRSGASGNPGGKGFFGVVHTQGFQAGEPFLIRRSGGDIFAALDLIAFSLQAAKQFF